jgi:TRAP-type mannitol/chloroaromatic compound transport system permease large subunit
VPTISMFYGIIIRMYFAPSEHPPPHFHVYYAEHRASINIQTCDLMEGSIPKKQLKLVMAWAELHQEELMADWALVMNGEEPFKIQPLQ